MSEKTVNTPESFPISQGEKSRVYDCHITESAKLLRCVGEIVDTRYLIFYLVKFKT